MAKIKLAIAGVGNCASSLLQGIEYYRRLAKAPKKQRELGLMHYSLGGYTPSDIDVVAAFDIDRRKIGKPLPKAIFAPPNCTATICPSIRGRNVTVRMGPIMDSYAAHMTEYPKDQAFLPARRRPCDVARVLKQSGAEILVCYLPVGSERAARFYAECCLKTGVSLVNCIPVFIVSDKTWARKFEKKGIPIVGDDIKAQVGATIVHRTLTKLFEDRGAQLDRTYQLNTGGNTDFLNMLKRNRLKSKKISKTEAVQSQLAEPLPPDNVHIGPSDYVPWQKDNKVCFIRMEGRGFGGVPLNLELRLSVEDSPNSGGVSIDAIRCCKVARDRGIGGPLTSVSSYTMKHPPVQYSDTEARDRVEQFIRGELKR
ncbi:MAG: inositol-3-phosphate synthase [Planctomycetes bacterium]|nr:inositol-3-phosphate synthase [Planctomycetota bacterium]